MTLKVDMLDELLKNCKTSENIFGQNGVIKQFVNGVTERALQAKLTTNLVYENMRAKVIVQVIRVMAQALKSLQMSQTEISVLQGRTGTFEPQFI